MVLNDTENGVNGKNIELLPTNTKRTLPAFSITKITEIKTETNFIHKAVSNFFNDVFEAVYKNFNNITN